MEMKIVTKYVNTVGPRIVAKGGGKQKTVHYDHSLNREQNYANAAAALLLEGHKFTGQGVDPETYEYRQSDNAHIFTVKIS